MSSQKPPKKPLNKALSLTGAGLQMGLIIYFGFLLGQWLDAKYKKDFFEEAVTLTAIFLAIYSLIKQVNKLND